MAEVPDATLDWLEATIRDHADFVRSASHELRGPLTVCMGHLELLEDDPVERAATVSLVLEELARLARIVDDLQIVANAGQPDFVRLQPVDVHLLVHDLTVRAGALAERRWRLDATFDGTVVADPHRITEAVMHLAHNAVQHTGPDGTIAVGAALDGDRWRVWVRDDGPGVPEDLQAVVFQRFTRGPGARQRYQGAGLGLAIVRLVAQAHGGDVEVRSTPGEGSTFTLRLPVDPDGAGG